MSDLREPVDIRWRGRTLAQLSRPELEALALLLITRMYDADLRTEYRPVLPADPVVLDALARPVLGEPYE